MLALETPETVIEFRAAEIRVEVRLHEATAAGLSHREFLELILQDELLVRGDRQIDRRITQANFRDVRRLEDFDFAFNTSIKRSQIFELATCRFIREHRDLLLVGPPGTGKPRPHQYTPSHRHMRWAHHGC